MIIKRNCEANYPRFVIHTSITTVYKRWLLLTKRANNLCKNIRAIIFFLCAASVCCVIVILQHVISFAKRSVQQMWYEKRFRTLSRRFVQMTQRESHTELLYLRMGRTKAVIIGFQSWTCIEFFTAAQDEYDCLILYVMLKICI